jgi:hypothetical protein
MSCSNEISSPLCRLVIIFLSYFTLHILTTAYLLSHFPITLFFVASHSKLLVKFSLQLLLLGFESYMYLIFFVILLFIFPIDIILKTKYSLGRIFEEGYLISFDT